MINFFIGREPTCNRLSVKAGNRVFLFGNDSDVPNTVSELHCQLTVHTDGRFELKNLKNYNYTYVNDNMISNVFVTEDDTISLGPDKWAMDFKVVLARLRQEKFITPATIQPYEASHLKKIYDDYNQKILATKIRERKLGAYQMLSGLLTVVGIAVGFTVDRSNMLYVYILSGLFILSFFIIRYIDSTKVPMQEEKNKDEFRKRYVCPNGKCHRYINAMYDDLVHSGKCPHCHTPFVFDGTGKKPDPQD